MVNNNNTEIYNTQQALSKIHQKSQNKSLPNTSSFIKPLTPTSATFNSTPRSIQKKTIDIRPQRSTPAISFNSTSTFQTPQQSLNNSNISPSPLALPVSRATSSHENYINSKVEKQSFEFMKFKGIAPISRLTMTSGDKKNSKSSEKEKSATIISKCIHGYAEYGHEWLCQTLEDMNLEINEQYPFFNEGLRKEQKKHDKKLIEAQKLKDATKILTQLQRDEAQKIKILQKKKSDAAKGQKTTKQIKLAAKMNKAAAKTLQKLKNQRTALESSTIEKKKSKKSTNISSKKSKSGTKFTKNNFKK